MVGENPKPNLSRFTVVELPGLEKLNEDAAILRQREGPTLSKALIGLNSLITLLAGNPYADRVISYRLVSIQKFVFIFQLINVFL